MKTVLVTGATGTLGRCVVESLEERGQRIRAFMRSDDGTGGESDNRPGTVRGNLATGRGVAEAAKGVDAIVHCATAFEADNASDLAGARNLIDAAHAGGVPHLVYISIVGIDGSQFSYFQGKREIESMIEQSGLASTILRTTQFHDFVLRMIDSCRDDAQRRIVIPAGLSFQTIEAREVGDALAELALGPPAGRVPEMAGPAVQTLEAMTADYIDVLAPGYLLHTDPMPESAQFHDEFRSGRNLLPGRGVGRGTWQDYLARRIAA